MTRERPSHGLAGCGTRTFIALELWDDESWYVLSDRHLQIARKTGALSDLPVALTSRTFVSGVLRRPRRRRRAGRRTAVSP